MYRFVSSVLTLLFYSPFTWTARADQENTNTVWTLLMTLNASDGAKDDNFGDDVAVDGSLIVIGAPGKDNRTGAVYVYRDLVQEAMLVLPNATLGAEFGSQVAVSGDTIVAGVSNENKVYVVAWNGAEYEEQPVQITTPTSPGDGFGWAVAVDQDRMVVSAPMVDMYSIGSVYLFERNDSVWTETAYFRPPESDMVREFGWSVDIDGDRIVVTAPGAGQKVGAAFVYELSDDGSWELLANMTPSGTVGSYAFATAISVDWVAIGALDALDGKGQVFLYSLPDLNETILQYNGQETDVFGYGTYLDLFGDTLMVGGLLVYEYNEGSWDLVVESPSYNPAARVATDGSTVVVGTPYDASTFGGAFVYGTGAAVLTDAPAASPIGDSETEGKPKEETGTEGETGGKPKGETETEVENGGKPEGEMETEGQTGGKPEGETETEGQTGGKPEGETESEGKTEAEGEAGNADENKQNNTESETSKSPSVSTGTGTNNEPTSSPSPVKSSVSAPLVSLLNITLLTMVVAILAVANF